MDFEEFLFVFWLFVAAFVITLFLALFMEIPCSAKAKAQSLDYKYGVMMGCMVKYKGEWIDYDRLRYMGD